MPASSHPEVFLVKGVLKTCSKFTRDHPHESAISIKVLCNFIEIALWHGCPPVNLLHIFETSFPKNTAGRLLRYVGLNSFKILPYHLLSVNETNRNVDSYSLFCKNLLSLKAHKDSNYGIYVPLELNFLID